MSAKHNFKYMIQALLAAALLGFVIFTSMQITSNVSNIQSRIRQFEDFNNLSNEIGLLMSSTSLCTVSLKGQKLDSSKTTAQNIKIFQPAGAGGIGPLLAEVGSVHNGIKVSKLEIVVTGTSGSAKLATLELQVLDLNDRQAFRPKTFKLILQTSGVGVAEEITACRAGEVWEQLATMSQCPAGELVAGFNSDSTLICHPGPPGPAGPPGANGGSGPSGQDSFCATPPDNTPPNTCPNALKPSGIWLCSVDPIAQKGQWVCN